MTALLHDPRYSADAPLGVAGYRALPWLPAPVDAGALPNGSVPDGAVGLGVAGHVGPPAGGEPRSLAGRSDSLTAHSTNNPSHAATTVPSTA